MKKITPRWITVFCIFIALAAFLWYFRSWNLEIGDGEFCCKQTAGERIYETTLSRAPLSHLLYRWMFFTLHPLLNWWVEDIIALSSCAAGLVFFYFLYRLVWQTIENPTLRVLAVLFPGSSLVLNVFCGHIEFYSWTVALLMVSAWLSWRVLQEGLSPLWPSLIMALSAAFHSSGVFYFPALLVLSLYAMKRQEKEGENEFRPRDYSIYALFFGLFFFTVIFHRWIARFMHGDLFRFHLLQTDPMEYLLAQGSLIMALVILGLTIYIYRSSVSSEWRQRLRPWWLVSLPWFVLFFVRAYFGLKREPLIEHLPPFREPYDHGAYLYMAFSLHHLYDKAMFHLWLAPFGLAALLYFCFTRFKEILRDPWLHFLLHFSFWAIVWSTLFYPQLRTRDWDLFVTMAIPFNLFVLYAIHRFWPYHWQRNALAFMVFVHLCISLPVAVRNAALFTDRGYVTLIFEPKPVESRVFLRGLELGITPFTQRNIRAGEAEVRIVPLSRGYQSWDETLYLQHGMVYSFSPDLTPIDNRIQPIGNEESGGNDEEDG